MSGRPVQSSSGKRKAICREPWAWGNQSRSPFQAQELLKHRCLQEISALARWDSDSHPRLCQHPALQHASSKDNRDRSLDQQASDWWVPPGRSFSSLGSQWHGHRSFPCVSPCLLHQRGPAFAFSSVTWFLARGAGCCSLAGLPIYLLFLAQGATREWYRLLPTPSAWEQGTRLGAQAQLLVVLFSIPQTSPPGFLRAGCLHLLMFFTFLWPPRWLNHNTRVSHHLLPIPTV